MVGDLTKSDFIHTLVADTIKTFGKIDVLVNNAGIYPATNITQSDVMQVWDQVFAIDLRVDPRIGSISGGNEWHYH